MTLAAENRLLANSATGSTGRREVRRFRTNSATSSSVPAAEARIDAENHPSVGPSISVKHSRASIPRPNACPDQANRAGRPGSDGTTRTASSRPNAPTGRLTRKMLRQPKLSTSSPPITGPKAIEPETIADHSATIRARRLGSGNAAVSRVSELGMNSAAPEPWSSRAATRAVPSGDSAQPSEATTKTTIPARYSRFAPNRSASAPASSSNAAKERVYPSTTQVSCDSPRPSRCCRV